MDSINVQIIHNLINNKEYVHYHFNDYTDASTIPLHFLYAHNLKLLKEKLNLLKNVDNIDFESINTTLKINITNKNYYSINSLEIILVVPLKNIKRDSIVKILTIYEKNNFSCIMDELISNIIKESNLKLIQSNVLKNKYKYLIIDEENLNILYNIIFQYILENNVLLRNISNKLLIKTINTVNYKTEQLDLFNYCINDNYIFSNIITIESKNFIDSSKILDNCIYIDKFYNYSTLINFNTGELNMIMLVRDIIGNIYKMEYKISIDEFMKKFYISDKTKNSIILELSKENNNAFS